MEAATSPKVIHTNRTKLVCKSKRQVKSTVVHVVVTESRKYSEGYLPYNCLLRLRLHIIWCSWLLQQYMERASYLWPPLDPLFWMSVLLPEMRPTLIRQLWHKYFRCNRLFSLPCLVTGSVWIAADRGDPRELEANGQLPLLPSL